jgi:hypothetical protein
MTDVIGRVLGNGKYRIDRRLGGGGQGEVTKARNSLWIKRSTMRRTKAPYIFDR